MPTRFDGVCAVSAEVRWDCARARPFAGRHRPRVEIEPMHSVQCRITSTDKPEIWIEIEIGVDNDNKPFWKLTRKSSVSFNAF